MGRAPLIAFVAVLAVGAMAAVGYLLKDREVVASTPSDYTGLTVPLPLPGGSEACADEIVFDTRTEIARFGATVAQGSTEAPPLEVTARGYTESEFRNDYRSVHRIDGGWTGTRTFNVPLTPPRTDSFGFFCVRNAGEQLIDLVGSHDGRAYSRPTVRVDGNETPTELQLKLLQQGESSLLSRVGTSTEHAATLKSFGAWWWWMLALALVTLAPLATFSALRTALVADGERLHSDVAPASLPLERWRRSLERVPGPAIVAGAGTLIVLWLCYWALSTHVFQNDEDQYVYLSRWLQTDLPSSLWNFDVYGRGLQRLEVWLLAIPSALFDSPWSLRGGRILNTIAFVSTAIPVYLLGRRLALRPQWAALPAVVSVAVPWAVVTTGFLTENVAYPACLWAIWAIWRTAADPSPGRDLTALVLIVVAGMARSGLLLLAPVLPLVAAGTAVRYGQWRRHLVLWIAVGFGLLVLALAAVGVAGGLSDRLAGGYITQLGFDPYELLSKAGGYLSKVVVGTAFLPTAIALPWLAVQLVRPRDRATFAFALTAVIAALGLLYSLNAAGPDERYVLYLAPLVLLPATLALARREVSPLGLGITSVLLTLLLLLVPWQAEQGPFGFFVSPAEMFYTRAVGLRLDRYVPGDSGQALTVATLALGTAGVALALVLARARALLTPARVALIVAAVALVVPLQAQYALSKYVNGAGSKSGPSDRQRAFADTLVPASATVGEFAEGLGQTPGFSGVWQEVQFYNQRIDSVYALGENKNAVPPGDRLVAPVTFDSDTGRVSSPEPLPDYLVVPSQVGAVRLRGEIVAAQSYIPVALLRVARPATLDWSASGFDELGNVPAGTTATARFYGTGLRPARYCGSFALLAPPEAPATYSFERDGREVVNGRVEPGQSKVVQFLLSGLADGRNVDIGVSGSDLRVGGIGNVNAC